MRITVLAATLALLACDGAFAQQTPEEAPDEEAPDEEAAREAELFGPPAGEEAAREEELFGPGPEAPATPAPTGDRDADLLGTPFSSAEDDIVRRLGALDERLTIGGRLWLQTTATVPDGVEELSEVSLASPNRLDLFADARPNDRLRAFASGRLQHDWTVRQGETDLAGNPVQPETVLLDQLWTKFDAGRRLFVTAGRQRIRWGTGRFWNPTDYLNQQRLDPLAVVDLRTGQDLLKLHLPFERAGANLYAVANLADARSLDEIGGALRAEIAFSQTELTASAALRKDQPARFGGDLSSGVGPFDVRLEVSAQNGAAPLALDPSTNPAAPFLALLPGPDLPESWAVQAVAGADLTVKVNAEDAIVFGVEVFYNSFGTEDVDTYPRLFLEGRYVPLYVGRAYGAASVLVQGPGQWDDQTFLLSAVSNLSDRTFVVRGDWRGTVLTWLQPVVYVAVHGGGNGELHYRFSLDPIPGILDDGISVAAPLLDVGLGTIVRF